MRTLWKASLGAVVLSLVLVAVVLAHSGVTGRLWDSADPAQPWQHGAQVAAVECTPGANPDDPGVVGDQIYGCGQASTTPGSYGEFGFDWGDDTCPDVALNDSPPSVGPDIPPDAEYICLYIIWAPGSQGQPEDTVTAPKQYIAGVTSRISFDNLQSGTGPNAITLANVTAQSTNFWLPVGLAAVSLVAVGALVITRRRRS